MLNVTEPKSAVEALIKKIGKIIVVAAPLAAGKPNHFLNALYNTAKNDSSIQLTLLTALSLQIPEGQSDLEKRFLAPFTKRVFGNYPNLDYETDRANDCVPSNIKIIEFYFQAGKSANRAYDQRNYLSSNYTHIVRDAIVSHKVNVICQQVVRGEIDGQNVLSLSCNSDLTLDMVDLANDRQQPLVTVAQINNDLPFMYGESVVSENFFDILIDNDKLTFSVFAPPKMSVSAADYMIGLHASTLIKDNGEIQIGIGSLGDALVYSLCLRQKDNTTYLSSLKKFKIDSTTFPLIKTDGSSSTFDIGLFAATEMLVDSFSELYKSKILKKKVFDSVPLQRLLNLKKITEKFSEDILEILLNEKIIAPTLSEKDVSFLLEFGILKKDVVWRNGHLLLPTEEMIIPNLYDSNTLAIIKSQALGSQLRNGAVAHGGFFLGPRSFYNFLKELPINERKLFRMKRISQINQLYGHEEIDRLQRTNGRFVNTCMKISLNGSANSDALEDGKQISGVGGQYNFVAMAHELPDARSILQLRSTRFDKKGRLESNIVFNYGNCTIPRHLRDVVITEYGIADLRGRTDEEVATELIQISDSRMQKQLIKQAISANKLIPNFKLKPRFKNNFPERYLKPLAELQKEDLFQPFPFGTDFTDEEITLGRALKKLKSLQKKKLQFFSFVLKSLFAGTPTSDQLQLLKRMQLEKTHGLKEKLYRKLIIQALN